VTKPCLFHCLWALALKRFQPGLKNIEVIAILGRITTALTGLHPSRSRRAR